MTAVSGRLRIASNTAIRPWTKTHDLPMPKRLLALTLSLALALGACATNRADPALESRDRAEMMAALAASADSWNKGSLKGHLAIYDPSVTVMTKTGPRPGIEPIERSFGETYFTNGAPKQTLRTEQTEIRLLSRDSALMTGRFILSGGGLPEQSGWFSLVWLRTAAGWKVVHDHTS